MLLPSQHPHGDHLKPLQKINFTLVNMVINRMIDLYPKLGHKFSIFDQVCHNSTIRKQVSSTSIVFVLQDKLVQ